MWSRVHQFAATCQSTVSISDCCFSTLLFISQRGFLFLARSPTYGKTTLSRQKTFREQDDIEVEGILLRLRKVIGPIPRIPASRADVFRSSVRHFIIELRISKDRCCWGRQNRLVTIAAEKQAKLGFPTAAGDRRWLGVTAEIMRRRSCGGGSDPGPLLSS